MANLNIPSPALYQAWNILGRGMNNSAIRANVAAQNYVNADSTSLTPGGDPYRRKTLIFKAMVDSRTRAHVPVLKEVGVDHSEFTMRYDPGHPSADEKGYVKMPNVKKPMEALDAQDANLVFSGCSQAYSMTTRMVYRLHDMIGRK